MGSAGKKKTTMAKLNRESRLREKRVQKEARKAARKLTAASDVADAAARGEASGAALNGLDADPTDGDEPESVAAVLDVAGDAPPRSRSQA